MKKLLTLILAGTLILSMTVFVSAEESSSASSSNVTYYQECKCTDPANCSNVSMYGSCNCSWGTYNGHPLITVNCKCGSVAYSQTPEEAASEAAALAQEATGIPWPTAIAAGEENKSVGEYMNNAVTSTPGLSQTTPVAQGGNVIINGQPSNQTFSVKKVLPAHVDSAKTQAATVGGTVINCVDVDGSVFFDNATVNFYMPGVVSGQNIQVYHFANGTWSPVNVAEIREDHVVVDMTAYGILAFVEIPAETPVETPVEATVEVPAE